MVHAGRDHPGDPRERLTELLAGYMPVQLAYVMARLRIADALDGAPMTVDDLGAATRTRPELMRRLVRGLAGVGLVRVDGDERVSLTGMGALLGSRAPGSMRDVALHRGGPSFMAWGALEHVVRTATPAFEAAHGESFFSYLRTHPEVGDAFDGTMTRLSQGVIEEAIAHYDFAGASRVLDVGGGRGHFVRAVLNAHPWLDGAVFDVPEVAEVTARELRRTGFDDRCVAIGGSFFEALPAGYDLHVLKWILHDWNDDSCRTLLEACRAALPAGGRLLVIEQLLPESIPSVGRLHPAVAMDLTMLVNFADARERRLDEYEELLASGGFAIGEVLPLPSGFSILEARPA